LIKVEMEARLDSVNTKYKDGEICLRWFHDEYSYERIAKIFDLFSYRLPGWKIAENRIKRALRYMAGRDRKFCSYSDWIANGWKC